MPGKMVFSLEPTENMIVVTRQVEVDQDDDGNAIFNTRRICREDLALAIQEIRVSLDSVLKQYQKDSKTVKK
jgi:hypothetical protein